MARRRRQKFIVGGRATRLWFLRRLNRSLRSRLRLLLKARSHFSPSVASTRNFIMRQKQKLRWLLLLRQPVQLRF